MLALMFMILWAGCMPASGPSVGPSRWCSQEARVTVVNDSGSDVRMRVGSWWSTRTATGLETTVFYVPRMYFHPLANVTATVVRGGKYDSGWTPAPRVGACGDVTVRISEGMYVQAQVR